MLNSAAMPGASAQAESEVTGSGVIQPQTDVVISAEIGGRVTALEADEGDQVEAEEVLVRLDDDMALAQLDQAQAAVAAAKANLASVEAEAQPAEVEAARADVEIARAQVGAAQAAVGAAEANLQAAQARHRAAQAKFDQLVAGPTQIELSLVQQQIALAEAQLWQARAQRDATLAGVDMPLSIPLTLGDVEMDPIVIANPIGPKQLDVEAAKATVSEAEASAEAAGIQYARLKAGPRAEDAAAAHAQVTQAQADVEIAQAALEQARRAVLGAEGQLRQAQAQLDLLRAGPRQEQVAVAQAQVEQAEAGVAILEAQRDKLSLATPIDGLVTERLVQEGEVVVAGAQLFTISRLDPVVLTVYVPQSQIGHVGIGQSADVSVDAYRGEVFQGEVVHVSSRAEFTPRDVHTEEDRAVVVVGVRIRIPNARGELKPGMSATATLR